MKLQIKNQVQKTMIYLEIIDHNNRDIMTIQDKTTLHNQLLNLSDCYKFIIIRYNPDFYLTRNNISTNPSVDIRYEELDKLIHSSIRRIEDGENIDNVGIYHLFFNEI